MSWSFTGIGKPQAVAAKAASDLEKVHCAEPEETIKGKVVEILSAALTPYPTTAAVKVVASGSQWRDSQGVVVNQLSLEISPIYGFVE